VLRGGGVRLKVQHCVADLVPGGGVAAHPATVVRRNLSASGAVYARARRADVAGRR
jgi:hypothetical protein